VLGGDPPAAPAGRTGLLRAAVRVGLGRAGADARRSAGRVLRHPGSRVATSPGSAQRSPDSRSHRHPGPMQAGGDSRDTACVWPSTEAGGRPSVCVSGLGGAADEWTDVGPALAQYGDVIAVELTLPVASPIRSGGAPLEAALDALDRVLASAPERSVLIGHSMGALASMLIAATQPHRLAGLVLTATFVPVARNGRSTLATAADYARHRVLFLAGAGRRRRDRSELRTVNRRTRAAGLRALAQYGLRPGAFHALADRVSCPVLLVHGGDDHYVPPAFALAAAARHPAWQSPSSRARATFRTATTQPPGSAPWIPGCSDSGHDDRGGRPRGRAGATGAASAGRTPGA